MLLYDKAGEEHYNLISALHKSMRESDPDATIYWLVRMLEAGEDPLYIARRIVRFASEDVGLADPRALRVSLDAKDAFDFLGMPEGSLALVEAAVYCALAPKSNALYEAENEAKHDVAEKPAEPVPPVIRNAVTKLMREVGYGRGYKYAHAEPEGVGGIECLPEALQGRRYYRPRGSGERSRPLAPARGGAQAAAGEVEEGGGDGSGSEEEVSFEFRFPASGLSLLLAGSSALPS